MKDKDDEEQSLKLASECVHAMADYGSAQQWELLETFGQRLVETATNFKENEQIQLQLALGAINAIADYGSSQHWKMLEIWGQHLLKTAGKLPVIWEKPMLTHGIVNLIISYAGEHEYNGNKNQWRLKLLEYSKNHPKTIFSMKSSILLGDRVTEIKYTTDDVIKNTDFSALLDDRFTLENAPDEFFDLWLVQNEIVNMLEVNFDDPNVPDLKAAHYRSGETLKLIVKMPSEFKIRLSSVAATNDKMEGKVLGKFLDPQDTVQREENMIAVQASFSAVDYLNQFRLYSGREAGAGVCLVFNDGYFATSEGSHYMEASSVKKLMSSRTVEKSKTAPIEDETKKQKLYWVLYYDYRRKEKEKTYFIHTPLQIASALTIDAHKAGNTAPSPKSQDWARQCGEKIGLMMAKLERIYNSICDAKAKDPETLKKDRESAWQLLIFLRHLVKDAAFAEEREMRLLKLYAFDHPGVKTDEKSNQLYTEYLPIFSKRYYEAYLDEVIVGPLCDDFKQLAQQWRHALAKNKRELVKFSKSEAPLAPSMNMKANGGAT